MLGFVLEKLPLGDRVLLVVDDTPTNRYGRRVDGADVHRNPSPHALQILPHQPPIVQQRLSHATSITR